MNLKHIRKDPVLIALGGGFLGFLLRILLYRIGFDEKGILPASHPLHLVCLVLTVGMALYLALKVRALPEQSREYPRLRLLLGLAAGSFLLVQAVILWRQTLTPLSILRFALTAAAGIAMAVCVFPTEKSRNLSSLFHGIICTAFAADMLGRYRDWSGNPQLPDYVFHVLAGVALSLCAYQTLALHTGLRKPLRGKFWGLLALFLCLLCLAGPEHWAFYLSGGLWAAVCLKTIVPPEAEETEEEETDVPA